MPLYFVLIFTLFSKLGAVSANPGFATLAIRKGQNPDKHYTEQLVPSISLSTTYIQKVPYQNIGNTYTSSNNPTREALEESLAALEKAKYCRVFSSGMAAIVAMASILNFGDRIICFNHIYSGTSSYFKEGVKRYNFKLDFVDLTNLESLETMLRQVKNTKMVWFESPSNPLMKVVDIKRLVDIVRKVDEKIIVVIDNTFMSPYFQKPITLGVDVVVHSVTKYINGHNDVMMGAAMTNNEEVAKHLKGQQMNNGSVPSAFDCYLVNRGVKTLHLRMERHYSNSLKIAKYLQNHAAVEQVLYPALKSHPQHKVHRQQTTGMSGMMSIYLREELILSQDFVSHLKLFTLGESLGGVESLIQIPSLMSFASVDEKVKNELGIKNNFLRISVGCEDVEDLIADLDQALNKSVEKTIRLD